MNAKDLQPSTADGPDNTRTAARNLSLLVCFLVIVLDGFNTTSISFVVPTLAHAWSLAPALFTSVFVATNMGAALGFMSTGPLSERFGLRAMGVASVVLFGASTLLTIYASNIASLSIIRLIAATGLGGALPIAITASAGIIGPKHKVAASLLVTTGMSVGTVTGGLVGGPLIHHFGWQSVFLAGGVLPFLLVPAFYRILPAGVTVKPGAGAARVTNPLKALFKDGLAAHTCLLWLFSFLIFMDVYALLFWVPTLLPAFGFAADRAPVGMAAFSIGGLSGNILMTIAVALMTVAGRLRLKSALAAGVAVMIVGVVALSQFAVSQGLVLLLIGIIGAGLVNGIMGQTALAVAFYPPEIRATGVGWGHAIGRVGSFVGPAIGGALLSLGWPARDIVLTATLPAGAALLTLLALSLVGRKKSQGLGDKALAES